jgi:hypothetical protein
MCWIFLLPERVHQPVRSRSRSSKRTLCRINWIVIRSDRGAVCLSRRLDLFFSDEMSLVKFLCQWNS